MKNPSPNLEDASKQGNDAEKRRVPRLNIGAEQFRMEVKGGSGGKIFSLTDLSTGGMGIRILERDDLIHFPVGTELKGTLNLHRNKYPVRARVRHLGHDRVGCEFENLADEVVAELRRFLDPEEIGKDLKPLPGQDSGTIWYHGPSGTDFLLRRGVDGQYSRFTLYVLSAFVQWDRVQGVTTGSVASSDEESEVRGVVRFETLLLTQDSVVDPGKLSIAKKVILSSNFSQDLKQWCVRQLEKGYSNGS